MTLDAPAVPASHPSRRRFARLSRYAGFAAAWVLFITVARLIVPQSSMAAPETDRPAIAPVVPVTVTHASPVTHAAVATAEPTDIGSLAGPEYLVRIHATPDGPRYTVCTPDGRVIREDLDGYTLAETFPSLDTAPKQAEAETDPDDPTDY